MAEPESTPTPIGPFLRSIRLGLNMTLRESANVTHVNFTYLGQVERGERTPTDAWLGSYVKALGEELAHRQMGDAA